MSNYRTSQEAFWAGQFGNNYIDRNKSNAIYSANLRLIDYSFVYHRDPAFPQDDFTWFLMEKR